MKYVSFVIPTRNGMPYLKYAIESVLKLSSDDIEVIVSVNDPNPETMLYLDRISDKRMQIVKPNESLSISANYEFALTFATGKWIQFLGSDDAILSDYLEKLTRIERNHPTEQVINWVRALYFWPGLEEQYGQTVLSCHSHQSEYLKRTRNTKLRVLMGFESMFEIPQVYTNSVIRRDLIEEIKESSNGVFFKGIIPDVYSSVALISNVNFYIRSLSPLTIVGSSKSSIGIGTRVYDEVNVDLTTARTIEDTIDPEIHKWKFQPYFYLESIRKYQISIGQEHQKQETFFSLLGMFAADLSQIQRQTLRRRLIDEKFEPRFLATSISAILILLGGTLRLIIQITEFLVRARRKIKIKRRSFVSNDREQFPDILVAGRYIVKMENELK